MRIVYIGAGSFRFSYGLFKNLCAAGEVIPIEVWLVDINEPLLEVMARLLKRMARKFKVPLRVFSTPGRREALAGADVVFKSISVGQQASEWFDIHVPQKFGIPQNTGDTCGPGGIFRSLRCVPVAVDIARDMAELCPDAPLLNYTNPQAPIVLGARQAHPSVQVVGLCHELLGGMGTVAKLLREAGFDEVASWEALDITYAGVNHFSWLLSLEHGGRDLYPVLRQRAHEGGKLAGRPFNFFLLEKHGYFPYPGSRHVAEFLPEYYNHFNHVVVAKHWHMPKLRNVGALRKARKVALWAYKQASKGRLPTPKPSMKGERAIEMTVDWLEARAGTHNPSLPHPRHHVVNLPNFGQRLVSNLPEDCVVEVPGYFSVGGELVGVPVGPLPPEVLGLVKVHAENTAKFVEAAVSGSPEKLLSALLSDPMCQFLEDDDAVEDIMWNMLYYEREWLPNFRESIPDLDDLRARKRFVSEGDLKKKNARAVKWPPAPNLEEKAYIPGT
ncbi:MAG: family 4 glycosyl hydrolase [Promethearchaeota archaeon]